MVSAGAYNFTQVCSRVFVTLSRFPLSLAVPDHSTFSLYGEERFVDSSFVFVFCSARESRSYRFAMT